MSTVRVRGAIATLVGAAALISAGPALANTSQTFNVQTTADGNQASPGTTDCASNSEAANGKCTLRSSIEAASNEPNGTDVTINVPAGTYKLTVANPSCTNFSRKAAQVCAPLASYALQILSGPNSIDISGAGAATTIVDANFLDRAFQISDGPAVTISGLTIEHGRPGGLGNITDCPANPQPEADGGGILTFGVLALSGDVLTDNIASGGGGGLSDQSDAETLAVSGSTFSHNKACQPQTQNLNFNRSGGGIDVVLSATTTIDSSVISNNTATPNGNGGGVEFECCSSVSARITSTTISGNKAFSGAGVSDDGGGVKLFFADTLSGNQASNNGGAFQDDNGGSDTFVDTTVAGNSAGSDGGGIWESGSGRVSFSTLDGNTSTGGGNLAVGAESFGTFSIDDSVVVEGSAGSANCNGPFNYTDNGYNLFDDTGDNGAPCGSSAGKHDIITASPKVGPLADHGGLTETEGLLFGSPAVDSASDSLCQTEPVPPSLPVASDGQPSGTPVDQRFILRPQGPHCDIGAFEATPDLGINGSVARNPINTGDQDTVTWTIANSNPSDAENATFTDPGAKFRIDSVTPSQGTCTHTKTTVSCHLGLIPPGGHVTIKIVITGLSPGRITLNGRTQTTGTDRKQRNNSATVRIRVKSKPKPPPPPPPPPPRPRPARPQVAVNHLGAGCHLESSGFDIHASAVARAGIRSFSVAVGGHVVRTYRRKGKASKRKTLTVHVRGANFLPSRTYAVLVKVVDRLGRTVHTTRHFTMCQPPPPKRGFTG
jgi:hypothetical protein